MRLGAPTPRPMPRGAVGQLVARYAPTLALGVAAGRVGLGVTALVVPDVPTRPWIGDSGSGPERRVLARALGARDIALGLGALLSARRSDRLRLWVALGGLADAGDVLATLIAYRHLPRYGRLVILGAAGGAALVAAVAVPTLSP